MMNIQQINTEHSPLLQETQTPNKSDNQKLEVAIEPTHGWTWWERPTNSRKESYTIDFSGGNGTNPSNGGNDENGTENSEIGSLAPKSTHKKLGQLLATSIAGNDITGSILYVGGYAAIMAGIYAPLCLLMVSILLYLFRSIYTEVVSALPLNGGTYNVLLNTTSKQIASVAAALSLLSYTATAVVSATSAMEYLKALWKELEMVYAVIILLGIFAVLNLMGITESAVVALILFVTHCLTLVVLTVFCSIKFARDPHLLWANWNTPTEQSIHWARSIFYGFGASMLGITGFETSANYVEEQAPGVFPKTLRNMWFAVAFFNPILSFLSFGVLPLEVVTNPNDSAALLTHMAQASGGDWLAYWVSIDAVLILSGGVITAYVGITGLVRRLALDRIMAQFLLHENSCRHTNHWIIIGFFILCSSLYLIVDGQVTMLSGVFTTSFLCVMAMFAVGNMMLKYKRSRLPRDIYTSWPVVVIGFLGVVLALIGNSMGNPIVLAYWALYISATLLIFMVMFFRIKLMKILLYFCLRLTTNQKLAGAIARQIQKINTSKVVFFVKDDNPALLNKVLLYIRDNEQSNWVLIVHVYQEEDQIPPLLGEHISFLEQLWPKFRIDYVKVKGTFGPMLVDQLSEALEIPKNFMFISTPSERFTHKLADLGGLRLVTH